MERLGLYGASLAALALAVGLAVPQAPAGAAAPTPADDEAMARKICSGCHAFPPPDAIPRDRWEPTVIEMTALMLAGIGAPANAPPPSLDFDPAAIARWYKSKAPDVLPAPEPWPEVGNDAARFARHEFRSSVDPTPLLASARFLDLDGDGRVEIVGADMGAGVVVAADPRQPGALRTLGRVPHPCHVELVDLDRDGLMDLVVADLGNVPPGDYLKGSVVWLQRQKDGSYRAQTLAGQLPRIADVEPADVDGDGDTDLVVGAFGWREVGGILLLENRTPRGGAPNFVKREIDPRTGSIHVPVADLNGDGKPDFMALFAQHHEKVVAFLNEGANRFRAQTVDEAPHPAWGSSGISLVDFDRDGDLDVLVTNGDMLDDFLLKPFHGIRWLENQGDLSFRAHDLARLPGVHRALAADFDGDGDLDVVACAFVQFKTAEGTVRDARAADQARMPSLVWLEQVAPGRYERHTLEQGAHHVTLDVADYDGDGDPDIVTGHFASQNAPWLEVWENLRVRGAAR
jgi:hypothetical protein